MTSFADTLLAGVTGPDRRARRVVPVAIVGALAVHLGAGALGLLPPRASAAELPPIEIEIEAPPAPLEPPKPEPLKPAETKPEETKPIATAPSAKVAAPPNAAPAPAAAHAGALLTANDDAKQPAGEAPVRFVTDPDGGSYGSGVVARGGTADVGAPDAKVGGLPDGTGTAPASPAKTVATASPAPALATAKDWSRAPRLGEADACKGWFPQGADEDAGEVVLQVIVKASGEVGGVTVVSESPRGQGFGAAAKSCLAAKRFEPALGKDGNAVAAAAPVRIRFSR
jgi:TonB family protein